MTVKELIKQLKTMPQDLDVYFQDHDSSNYELSSNTSYAFHWKKDNIKDDIPRGENAWSFEHNPDECVVIRG